MFCLITVIVDIFVNRIYHIELIIVFIDRYNAVLVPKLQTMGVEINDLNALVKPHVYEYIRNDDKIHLSEFGIEACAKQVAEFIINHKKGF